MICGGLGIFWRKMYRLMNQGSHTVNSWPMNFLVGTEKTSARNVRNSHSGIGMSLTVQFFQCKLLGFSDKTEYHEPGYEVKTSVKTDYRHIQQMKPPRDSV